SAGAARSWCPVAPRAGAWIETCLTSLLRRSEDRQEQVPSSLKREPSGEGWPTRAGERPAPWTLPQNLIDEARVLADGRIPLPEPERVPWDVLIAQAVNWDIPERLAASRN